MSIATELQALAVTDSLKHAALPGTFTLLPWAGTTGSWSEANGWSPGGYLAEFEGAKAGSRSGIYYNASKLTGGNAAVGLKKTAGGLTSPRQIGLWLFSAAGEKPTGYQLAMIAESAEKVKFILRKWVAGEATVLKEVTVVSFHENDSIYLVAKAGKVSMWRREGEAEPVIVGTEVADATFTEGFSGVDGNGSNPALVNFATSTLGLPVPLGVIAGSSSAALSLTVKTVVPLGAVAGVGTASLALKTPTRIPLAATAGVATAALTLKAQTRVTLQVVAGTSTAAIAVHAPTTLQAKAAGTSSAALVLHVSILPGYFVRREGKWIPL